MLPDIFWTVPYVGARHPGAHTVGTIASGANCQTYAYSVLRYFGRNIPEFRSSELWEDTRYTFKVTKWMPLDLLLFNRTRDAFGAHVGVYAGGGYTLHLAKAVGRPVLWRTSQFSEHRRYKFLLGAKRARFDEGVQLASGQRTCQSS